MFWARQLKQYKQTTQESLTLTQGKCFFKNQHVSSDINFVIDNRMILLSFAVSYKPKCPIPYSI